MGSLILLLDGKGGQPWTFIAILLGYTCPEVWNWLCLFQWDLFKLQLWGNAVIQIIPTGIVVCCVVWVTGKGSFLPVRLLLCFPRFEWMLQRRLPPCKQASPQSYVHYGLPWLSHWLYRARDYCLWVRRRICLCLGPLLLHAFLSLPRIWTIKMKEFNLKPDCYHQPLKLPWGGVREGVFHSQRGSFRLSSGATESVLKLIAGRSSRYTSVVYSWCCFSEEHERMAWRPSVPGLVHLLSTLLQKVKGRAQPRAARSLLCHWKWALRSHCALTPGRVSSSEPVSDLSSGHVWLIMICLT